MALLFAPPFYKATDITGKPIAGAFLSFYQTQTSTPQPIYADVNLSIALTNPVQADGAGAFPAIWLDDLLPAYKFILQAPNADNPNVPGVILRSGDPYNSTTQNPQTPAEITAAITPTNFGYLPLDPRRYGAKFDGITDDTTALIAAEVVAFTAGASLTLPQGTTLFTGKWTVRIPIIGYGTTIKQNQVSVDSTATSGVVGVNGTAVVIEGLTIDGGFKTQGLACVNFSHVRVVNVTAQNCVSCGFSCLLADNVTFLNCRAFSIRYAQIGANGLSADGFYFGGCTRSRWVGCRAEDVRRIGFVTESNSGTNSDLIKAISCVTSNTNNCDDSATEFNAAFWSEHTNSVDWVDCIGYGIAGNAGQTSKRVTGMVLLGGGNNDLGMVRAIRCAIYGTNGSIPTQALQVTSNNAGVDVVIQDCLLSKAATGVLAVGAMNSLTIQRLRLSNIVNVNGGQGGVVIDGTGASIGEILIDEITADTCTFHADSGTVQFFAAPSGCKYTLRNLRGAQHMMKAQVDRVSVYDSEISCGTASGFSSFLGTVTEFHDSVFTSRNSSNTDYICAIGLLNSGSKVLFHGGEITGFGSGWNPVMGSSNVDLTVEGTRVDNYTFNIQTQGTFLNKFDDVRFYNVPATNGTIKTNGGGVPTKQTLIVQNCYFKSNNAADTPIVVNINQPTKSILHGNIFDTATNLYSITPTSQVNNISI